MNEQDYHRTMAELEEMLTAARAARDWKRAQELTYPLVVRVTLEHGAYSARADEEHARRVRVADEAGDRAGADLLLRTMKRPRTSMRDRQSIHPVEYEEVQAALAEAAELDQLSEQLFDARRWAECAPVTETLLELFTWVYGTMHPEVAGTLGRLGVLRQRLGGPDDALPLHQRALDIQEALFGPASHPTAIALFYLGMTLRDAGQNARALQVLERYTAAMRHLGKPPSPHALEALEELKAANPMTRADLFALVAEEVFRDGVVEEHENEILNKLVHFLKLSPDRAKDICRAAKARFKAGELGEQRPLEREALYESILVAVTKDGRVDSEEAAMLKGMRKLLNLDEATHERLLAKISPLSPITR